MFDLNICNMMISLFYFLFGLFANKFPVHKCSSTMASKNCNVCICYRDLLGGFKSGGSLKDVDKVISRGKMGTCRSKSGKNQKLKKW